VVTSNAGRCAWAIGRAHGRGGSGGGDNTQRRSTLTLPAPIARPLRPRATPNAQVLRDLARPELPPDVVCDCRGFAPLNSTAGPTSSSSSSTTTTTTTAAASSSSSDAPSSSSPTQLQRLLKAWRPSTPAAEAKHTAALVTTLLRLYLDHQRRRLSTLGDERMTFELGVLEDTGCSELLLTGAFCGGVCGGCCGVCGFEGPG